MKMIFLPLLFLVKAWGKPILYVSYNEIKVD